MTDVKLLAMIGDPDQHLAYVRDIRWDMPLPVKGDWVSLGRGLIGGPLLGRVFRPDQQEVMLTVSLTQDEGDTWLDGLLAAGFTRAELPADAGEPLADVSQG